MATSTRKSTKTNGSRRATKDSAPAKKASPKKAAPKKAAPKKAAPKEAAPKKAKSSSKRTKVYDDGVVRELDLLTVEELEMVTSRRGLLELLRSKSLDAKKVVRTFRYELELERLQIEMVKLQRSVQLSGRRVAIILEGRDAAGKGGTIRRFIEHLNPRTARTVALQKPTEVEQGQWYFQRYVKALPNPGEITFFDRSWYNRAVVEPVMDFCTKEQYELFIRQVPEFEHMLYEDGVEIIKFWFSISKDEQRERFDSRRTNPLKQWKISPVDERAQERWDVYTKYKEQMFARTHTTFAPWIIVKANSKKKARLESMRYVLSYLDYEGKDTPTTALHPDPDIVRRFHRSTRQID